MSKLSIRETLRRSHSTALVLPIQLNKLMRRYSKVCLGLAPNISWLRHLRRIPNSSQLHKNKSPANWTQEIPIGTIEGYRRSYYGLNYVIQKWSYSWPWYRMIIHSSYTNMKIVCNSSKMHPTSINLESFPPACPAHASIWARWPPPIMPKSTFPWRDWILTGCVNIRL